MDDKLKDVFSNINDWLKHAEAKSATLIAGNGFLIFGIIRLSAHFDTGLYLNIYLGLSVFLCALSLTICLLSVVPSLNMPWESIPQGTKLNDNLQYFAHIAKYTPISYLTKLSEQLGIKNKEFNAYEKDLAFQIITNSVIATKKYGYFNKAIWLTLAAVISPLMAFILLKLRRK